MSAAPAPAAKRGRPARLSRDAILDAAFALLEHAPREALTVAAIAAEVDAVPAALYRHFGSLDDLLDAALARILARAGDPRVRRGAGWRGQIRHWMRSLRRTLLRYPPVMTLIGRRGRTSPAWLDAVATLVPILRDAGLGGAQLARTHLWLAETTVALISQEAAMALPEQLLGARASLGEMSKEGRAQLAPLLTRLRSTDGEAMFDFAVERTIAAIADLVEEH
jgi:AcrR family transcriptional regulator